MHMHEEGSKVTLVEDATSIRVSVAAPWSVNSSRSSTIKCDTLLCNTVRGEHAEAVRKANKVAGEDPMKARLPTGPGDMAVNGEDERWPANVPLGRLGVGCDAEEASTAVGSKRVAGDAGSTQHARKRVVQYDRQCQAPDQRGRKGRARTHRRALCV